MPVNMKNASAGWRIGATRRARPKGFPGWQRMACLARLDPEDNDEETLS